MLALEHEEPELDRLIADLERAETALAPVAPPDAAPRVGRGGRGRAGPTSTTPATSAPSTPASPSTSWSSTATGPRDGHVPHRLRGSARHRARRVPRACSSTASCSTTTATSGWPARPRRSRSATGGRPAAGPLASRWTARSPAGASARPGSCWLGDRVLCEAEVDAVAGDRAALPEVSPRRAERDPPVIEAGDDLPLTVPGLLGPPPSGPTRCCWSATTHADLRRGRPPVGRAGPGPAGRRAGAGTRVAILHPNGPDFVVAWLAAGPDRRGQRAAQHVLDQRRAGGPAPRAPTSPCCWRRLVPVARLPGDPAGPASRSTSAPPPLMAERCPSLRRIAVALAADGPGRRSTRAGRWPGCWRGRRRSTPTCCGAEAAVTPADRW